MLTAATCRCAASLCSPYQCCHLHNEAEYRPYEAMYLQYNFVLVASCSQQASSKLNKRSCITKPAARDCVALHTLTAIHSVRKSAPIYTEVAIMRPFSNIFFNCARGPMRNIVLRRHRSVSCNSIEHVHSIPADRWCCLPDLPCNKKDVCKCV